MAVCIVCVLTNIFECSVSLNLVLVYGSVIFVCDAITVCRDYIVVTCSAFRFTGKNYGCFVSNNFNIADHWSSWFFSFSCTVCFNCLGTSIVLACFCSYDSCCSVIVCSCCVFCCIYFNFSAFNRKLTIFNSYICICKVKFINSPRVCFRHTTCFFISILWYDSNNKTLLLCCIYNIFVSRYI